MHIGEYELESPLMNAGGLVRTVHDVRLMARTAVGAVLAGSYTLEPRAGNGGPDAVLYYHDAGTGITYNALGLPNPGMEYVATWINEMINTAHDHGKPFILNFAPVTADPAKEVTAMTQLLVRSRIEELDGLELNASCPNVLAKGGTRHELLCHNFSALGDTLFSMDEAARYELAVGSLIVRVSPFRNKAEAAGLVKVVKETGTDAVAAFNTFPDGVPHDAQGRQILEVPGGAGGRSGPGMRPRAESHTMWLNEARARAGAVFDIIGSNGIASGEAIRHRLSLGTAAVSATTIFYEAESWADAADGLLREYAELV